MDTEPRQNTKKEKQVRSDSHHIQVFMIDLTGMINRSTTVDRDLCAGIIFSQFLMITSFDRKSLTRKNE